MPSKRNLKFLLFSLLFLGIVAQALVMVKSGLIYSFGMGFWGANGHDGVWHLALINQALKGFPPPHPTFAGHLLTNYHYFYDLLLALVNRITTIPVRFLYFQIFPILLAFGLGILSFLVGFRWRKDFWTGFWLVFFNFFAGSFGYLVTLWRSGEIGGESIFWSMQSVSTPVNPPFALSLVLILFGFWLLLKIKKWNLLKILATALLFGLIINVKAYAGLVVLAALGVFAFWKFLKKERVYFFIFGFSLLISLALFLVINPRAGSLFIFQPFWFIHSMFESTDRFYLPRLALARYFLVSQGIGPRLIAIEIFGLAVFLTGNLGTRIIGLWDFGKRIKKFNEFDGFLVTGSLVGLIIPLLFVQKGTVWNTIQFFYYFLFFANFYAAATMAKIIRQKKAWKYWLIVMIVLLTVPTSLASLRDYLGFSPPTAIVKTELTGLAVLKEKKEGVVLTFPYDEVEKDLYQPTLIPLRAYSSTAYVSAFSGKQTFLEDEVNLAISGYDWEKRRQETLNFFTSKDEIQARGFLLNNQVSYVYLVGNQKLKLSEEELGLKRVFENNEVKIYQVNGIIEE